MYRLVFNLEGGQAVTCAKKYERDYDAKKALREIHGSLLMDAHILVESSLNVFTNLMIIRSMDIKSVEIKKFER